jgi:sugar diacid utilization regulator
MLADADGERLQVAGCSGLSSDYLALVSDGSSLLVHPAGTRDDSPSAAAYRERRTIAVPDVQAAPDYGRLQYLAPAQGYRALVVAPMPVPDDDSGDPAATRPAGVVVGYSIAAREFTPSELELIELLAGQASLALQTARLRSAQQQVIGELSRANEELRHGRAALDWAEQRHRELMQMVLDEVGLAGLVVALATTLGASVTVEGPDGELLARAPEEGYRPPPDAAARRRQPARAALEATTRSYDVVQVSIVRHHGPVVPGVPVPAAEKAWVAPVVLGQELVGRLWVTAPAAVPAPVQLRVIERFALVVALELLKERHVIAVEARLSGDLLADLLRPGGPVQPHAVLDRAAALGHDLTRPHVVAVLSVDGRLPPGVRMPDVVRAATGADTPALVGTYDEDCVLLLPADVDGAADPGDVLSRLHAHAARVVGRRCAVTLVAGPTACELVDYATAHRVTCGAGRLRRATRPGGLVDIRGLGLSALLLETGAPDALRRFAQSLLRPLAAHDARRGGDLIPTLRAWLRTGCSTTATAEELVVHPNTVGYRLRRIEQLTGRNLRGVDIRLELQLALTIRDIILLDG